MNYQKAFYMKYYEIYEMINLCPISEQNLTKYNESRGILFGKDKNLVKGTIYEYLSTSNERIIIKNNILVSLYRIFKKEMKN